jgi:hypothetical protein
MKPAWCTWMTQLVCSIFLEYQRHTQPGDMSPLYSAPTTLLLLQVRLFQVAPDMVPVCFSAPPWKDLPRMATALTTFLWPRLGDTTKLGLLPGILWSWLDDHGGPSFCHWPLSDVIRNNEGCQCSYSTRSVTWCVMGYSLTEGAQNWGQNFEALWCWKSPHVDQPSALDGMVEQYMAHRRLNLWDLKNIICRHSVFERAISLKNTILAVDVTSPCSVHATVCFAWFAQQQILPWTALTNWLM